MSLRLRKAYEEIITSRLLNRLPMQMAVFYETVEDITTDNYPNNHNKLEKDAIQPAVFYSIERRRPKIK